jgi:hypothetical protein
MAIDLQNKYIGSYFIINYFTVTLMTNIHKNACQCVNNKHGIQKKKKITNMVKKEMLHTSTNFGNTKKKNKYD